MITDLRARVLGSCLLTLAVVFAAKADEAKSAESWADARLTVRNGLFVWLDAAKLPEAQAAMNKPPVKEGEAVDFWPDASGAGRHVSQEAADARPAYRERDGFRSVRFDGKDDFLAAAELDRSKRDLTLFVVAASYSSPGWFTGFLALSGDGKNDFETGLNLDQGVGSLPKLDVLNVEGAGSQGMANLLTEPTTYGSLLRICVESSPGKGGLSLRLNGKPQGSRDREESTVEMDRLFVGARCYELGAAPFVRGFFDGEIAEVLIYDRALEDSERDSVEAYLAEKYGKVEPLPSPHGPTEGAALKRVENPPPVQVFVPGFVARRMPVELPNVNNVLYREDGKLVALGYGGDVWLLSDTDGDGLEDRTEKFWDNQGRLRSTIGLALTPPGYKHGRGVFIASKSRCVLVVDADGDDVAEKEIVVADGWSETFHNVDALGVAVDPRDGSVYFGLGTVNFADPYEREKNPEARYPLERERGVILRVAPDFSSREIVATGIRFPVGLRFNAEGDLFCTDQEGATWAPNGNPLDELLHIQKGRHYGFPARHPVHLPDVIDEPSVFDYAPQHQSTCGLNFNEPATYGGPTFGPARWRSDAIVTGYSRGKLYRTKLVPTPSGYVASNQLFASFSSLVCDACISPTGDLVVACHSGAPDWGSGPAGEGTLYKLVYTEPELPQPTTVWAASPREVRVAFDRPLNPHSLTGALAGARIEYGRYVAPGDRFEALWPGYQVVRDQQRSPRFELPIRSMQVTGDGRTLILATDPHLQIAFYALTLPGLGRTSAADASRGEAPQIPETDLGYDLSGLEAVWQSAETGKSKAAWLPHLDLAAAQSLIQGSAEHDDFVQSLRAPGELRLRTTLDLKDMLWPAVQPGSKLDFKPPPETVTLVLRSKRPFRTRVAERPEQAAAKAGESFVARVELPSSDRVPFEATLTTTSDGADLSVAWHTNEDARERALPLRRFLLPWAPESGSEAPTAPRAVDAPELAGGNWERGRRIFFSEAGQCGKCHALRGEGGTLGPDLSNLPHRDYASVLRDVNEPSFALNPDYISQIVALHDGRVLTGVVRTEGDRLVVGDQKGVQTSVSKSDVERMQPSRISTMPEDLTKSLGPERTRDLLTFLLTDPPRMPDYGRGEPPAPHPQAEVDGALAGAPEPPAQARPIHVTLVAGRKDHGPGEHDYPAWKEVWSRLLGMADEVEVSVADDWPSPEQFQTADTLVFYQQGKWTPERANDMDAFLERGGGAVYIHYAVDGGTDAPGFAQRIGLAWQGDRSKFRHGPLDLGFDRAEGHPIARNFDKVHFHDESYWNLVGDPDRIALLATGKEEGADQPLFWTMQPGKGRVFVSIPGHFAWTFDDPLFRILLLRGIAWTAKQPVDRFNPLVAPGARISPASE